jgi:hypothetical protein
VNKSKSSHVPMPANEKFITVIETFNEVFWSFLNQYNLLRSLWLKGNGSVSVKFVALMPNCFKSEKSNMPMKWDRETNWAGIQNWFLNAIIQNSEKLRKTK